jgi:hypothetical protein
MDILNSHAFTGPYRGTRILSLVDVFENNGDVPCPQVEDFGQYFLFVIGHKFSEVVKY